MNDNKVNDRFVDRIKGTMKDCLARDGNLNQLPGSYLVPEFFEAFSLIEDEKLNPLMLHYCGIAIRDVRSGALPAATLDRYPKPYMDAANRVIAREQRKAGNKLTPYLWLS